MHWCGRGELVVWWVDGLVCVCVRVYVYVRACERERKKVCVYVV